MAKTTTTKLASGYEMPLVGFGLWKVPADQAADTVYNVSPRRGFEDGLSSQAYTS